MSSRYPTAPPAVKVRGPGIVVIGGGFGGVYASIYLSRSELREDGATVTLIDRKNYFTFTPLLAEVVSGGLGREHVTYPYRILARRYGFTFMKDSVCSLDVERRVVITSQGEVPYDYLVIATGGEPRYFGNESIKHHSMPYGSVNDAMTLRGRIMDSLERASVSADEREKQRLLTFVVAGAGPAGVEVASEIHNLCVNVLRPYFPQHLPVRVILADGGPRILGPFDEDLAREGQRLLSERGIEVRLNTKIENIDDAAITASGPEGIERIEARTLIWTAGSAPGSWVGSLPLPTERGALKVDDRLRVEGFDNVFAVGDVAHLVDPRSRSPYPRVAPIAISQGIKAAANIENHYRGRDLDPYHAHHAGKIVSLGCGVALVDILGFRFTGRLAWMIYRGAYLLKLVGLKNKVRVLISLMLNSIFEPDVAYEETGRGR